MSLSPKLCQSLSIHILRVSVSNYKHLLQLSSCAKFWKNELLGQDNHPAQFFLRD
jgi:hypothetical protein